MSSIHLTIHGLRTTIITHERNAYVAYIDTSNQDTIQTYLRNKGFNLKQTRSIDINNAITTQHYEQTSIQPEWETHAKETQAIERMSHGANISIKIEGKHLLLCQDLSSIRTIDPDILNKVDACAMTLWYGVDAAIEILSKIKPTQSYPTDVSNPSQAIEYCRLSMLYHLWVSKYLKTGQHLVV